ncbi:class I SAM-dependent methyltransferase [Pseudoponticoccus marisrubri]|uniref:Methyltransferase domain-containing protein n=1 Tax=Pseudoponticoccus marisrubri TaxID=1685382 RepID=A0A0W7WN09_9RHOB|nr:methyltransferase domain-containing protein [Pseudoponticoccus marisrubri]KUF11880.1 hypothetical protein AVJ23_04670 [Pseudoponticoccus marisrubri]
MSDPPAPQFAPENDAQRRFWDEGPGRVWAALHDELDAMYAQIGAAVLAAAAPQRGECALDIGCGAGATTRALARAVGPEGRATGLDVSSSLLGAARAASQAAPPAPDYVLADAQLWRPATPVDLALSRMGVMFFADPDAAFANIRAMLRPGGRLAFICWRGAEENPLFSLPHTAAVEMLGPPEDAASDPDAPGPMAFRDPDRVFGILQRSGFERITIETVHPPISFPGDVTRAAELATAVGPASRHLRDKGAGPEALEQLRARLRDDFAPYSADGLCVLPASMNLVTARNPG